MTPVALLAEVLARGVEVIPTDRGTIRVRPVSRLTPELLDQLRQHKPEILVLLTQSQDARAGSVRLLVAERAAVFHALVEGTAASSARSGPTRSTCRSPRCRSPA